MNSIQNHLQECDDDLYDAIAPVTQDTECQDEDAGNTDTHSDLNESYDLSEDLGIPSNLPNNKSLISTKKKDNFFTMLYAKHH